MWAPIHITRLNTVADVAELNPILRTQRTNAIGAICGMVELSPGWKLDFDQPVVAVTSFGFAERISRSGSEFSDKICR
jgi:uncharacterized protein (UPF0261 family)